MSNQKNLMKKIILFLIHISIQIVGIFLFPGRKLLQFLQFKKYYLEFEVREDDIYIASFSKSGTTWVQMIIYQSISDGNMYFSHIHDISPYFEYSLMGNENLNKKPSPRIIKTHYPYGRLPRKFKGKFIYLMRNGKDVAYSLYNHFKPVHPNMTFEESFNTFFLKWNKGWFKHLKGWLTNKRNLNILYIKYEELLADLEGNVRKLIDFCGFKIEESEFHRILERSSFNFMKKYQEKFDGRIPPEINKLNAFIRCGKAKQGHIHFSEKQNKIYEDNFKKFLAGFDLDYYKN